MEAGENQGMIELPIACDRAALGPREAERQRELWSGVLTDAEERQELEDGYRWKLPSARLADAAELMAIERRCCGFLQIRLEADASEPHLWFALEGPPGTKRVLDVELELMLCPRNP